MSPNTPLTYPEHYPPRDKWKRFFIGVRWLGPDLSFFKALSDQQQSRTADSLAEWGGGTRQRIASTLGVIFARHLRWKSPYFLPGDNIAVIMGGPRFSSMDGDLDTETAIDEIEAVLGVKLPLPFWRDSNSLALSDLVTALLAAGATPDSREPPLDQMP